MHRKLSILLFVFVLVPALMFAQDGKLRGRVTDKDSREPLVGANVQVQGTTLGAAADVNGDYIVLGVPPGVYTLKVSYVGYSQLTLSNVRISSNQTTSQDFQLLSSAVQVQGVEIVAERPLIQRNTTNTVRVTTQEDIQNLPVRGTQAILALQAGVVRQNGNLYIRGGRSGEVAYYVDGTSASNPLFNTENVSIVQEAIEELQLQSGGYTAEIGGSNSAVARTSLRTGGSQYKASIDYLTDDFAKPGSQFLNTSAAGYRNVVGTLSGPVPYFNSMKFFVAAQNNFVRNNQFMWITPFSFDNLVTDINDGRGAGVPLPGTVGFKQNYLPGNWANTTTIQGTLLQEIKNIKLRLTGSYNAAENPSGAGWPGALPNIFRTSRLMENRTKTTLVSLRATHVLDANTFYEASVAYSSRVFRQFDPNWGEDYMSLADSAANAAIGFTNYSGHYLGPLSWSTIYGFGLSDPNAPNNGGQRNKQRSWGGTFDFTRQMSKTFELKVGAKMESWTMRLYSLGNVSGLQTYLHGSNGNTPRSFVDDAQRSALVAKAGSINNYGYTVDGVETNDGPDAPYKPLFMSAYAQTKLEYRDIIINFGLRYEYMNSKAKTFADPTNPDMNTTLDVIDQSKLVDAPVFSMVLPRLSFSFPVTDNSIFYAQYGKYAQMPSLNQLYVGNTTLSRTVSPITRGNAYLTPVGLLMTPERTTSYEMGVRQMVSDNFAVTFSGFYKDTKDQLSIRQMYTATGGELFKAYLNNDFGTIKGLEMTLELRRSQGFAARLSYTLSDARGTASSPSSGWGAVESNIGRPSNFINQLDYNQTHRGTLLIDYRFEEGKRGPILSGLGGNLLFTFNSGHSYTAVKPIKDLGQSDAWTVGIEPLNDPRFSFPIEPINSSTTPFFLNIDMNVSKSFPVGPVKMEIYVNVTNLLNAKQIVNVYPTTGSAQDDGWLSSPAASHFKAIPNYEAFYRAINNENRYAVMGTSGRGAGTGADLYGIPRQIRVGLRAEI